MGKCDGGTLARTTIKADGKRGQGCGVKWGKSQNYTSSPLFLGPKGVAALIVPHMNHRKCKICGLKLNNWNELGPAALFAFA